MAVTDLTADDFEVLEDNVPQQVKRSSWCRPAASVPESARVEPNTVAESRERAAQPDARAVRAVPRHAARADRGLVSRAESGVALLDRVIGEDDLVGVMTPEMSAAEHDLLAAHRVDGAMLEDNWSWGERGADEADRSAREELESCYPDVGGDRGLAQAIIERRREPRRSAPSKT